MAPPPRLHTPCRAPPPPLRSPRAEEAEEVMPKKPKQWRTAPALACPPGNCRHIIGPSPGASTASRHELPGASPRVATPPWPSCPAPRAGAPQGRPSVASPPFPDTSSCPRPPRTPSGLPPPRRVDSATGGPDLATRSPYPPPGAAAVTTADSVRQGRPQVPPPRNSYARSELDEMPRRRCPSGPRGLPAAPPAAAREREKTTGLAAAWCWVAARVARAGTTRGHE